MQNHRVCTAFGETVLSKCAKNIGFPASFSEIDLQKLQKHACFLHILGKHLCKKSVKTRCFFAIFEKQACIKEAENTRFFPIFDQIFRKTKKHRVVSVFLRDGFAKIAKTRGQVFSKKFAFFGQNVFDGKNTGFFAFKMCRQKFAIEA